MTQILYCVALTAVVLTGGENEMTEDDALEDVMRKWEWKRGGVWFTKGRGDFKLICQTLDYCRLC